MGVFPPEINGRGLFKGGIRLEEKFDNIMRNFVFWGSFFGTSLWWFRDRDESNRKAGLLVS